VDVYPNLKKRRQADECENHGSCNRAINEYRHGAGDRSPQDEVRVRRLTACGSHRNEWAEMLTVTQLANQSGTSPHVVRYYTRVGLLRAERNPDNGYHLYKPRDISWLRFIRQAKRLGYTLSEIKAIRHDADQGHSPCPRVRKILQRRLVENRRHLEELMALQTRLEQAFLKWADMPDGVPDGDSVCHLIESFGDDSDVKQN
jgi:DNA-binding transcriptional MerR regulator